MKDFNEVDFYKKGILHLNREFMKDNMYNFLKLYILYRISELYDKGQLPDDTIYDEVAIEELFIKLKERHLLYEDERIDKLIIEHYKKIEL